MMSCPVNSLESNRVGLHYALEECFGTLPTTPEWKLLKINDYTNDPGTTYNQSTSDTINEGRQRQEGGVSSQDTSMGFMLEMRQKNMLDFLMLALCADWRYKNQVVPSATTTTAYTVAASTGFVTNTLAFAEGFAETENNGLKLVSAVTATSITVGGLTANAGTPATAKVTRVGVQGASGDIGMTVASGVTTLTSTALDFTTLGLIAGEWVHIGGDDVATRFATAGCNGWVRIKSIAANAVILDRVSGVAATDNGASKTIRLFVGHVLKNEKSTDLIKDKSVQFERKFPNNEYQYLSGCVLSTLALSFPEVDGNDTKIKADASFIGKGSEVLGSAKSGNRSSLTETQVFTTYGSFGQFRLVNDDSGVTFNNYLVSMDLNINNNTNKLPALGEKSTIGVNKGTFMVEGSVTAYFKGFALEEVIRNNNKLSLNQAIVEKNAGLVIDLPRVQVGNAKPAVSKDQVITVPLDLMAVEHPTLGHTMLIQEYPYLPSYAHSA